jgi:esterase/lipase superfamily enzyme
MHVAKKRIRQNRLCIDQGSVMTPKVRTGAWFRVVSVIPYLVLLLLTGCQTGVFMPAPNLYVNSRTNPFENVPSELQSTEVKIIYATDRLPTDDGPNGSLTYGDQRSGYLACGVSTVAFGKDLDWAELVKQSLARRRVHPLHMRVTGNEEMFRFPDTNLYAKANAKGSATTGEPARSEEEATSQLHRLIHERLEHAEGRDAYVFIHGYNVPFDDAVTTMAQFWHFLGRVGVPIVYSWPARGGGFLAYANDLESGEFTIWHLKRFLASLASCPDIKRIHVIAHSRGGNIVLAALRELHLFHEGAGVETRQALKLGNVICAAPDLDFEVATQRILPEGMLAVPSRLTVYISKTDRAMGFTSWLFGGLARFGTLTFGILTPTERRRLETVPSFDLIDARIKRSDWYGHSYFYQSPAVSSDIILILRDDLDPGKENGRPLGKGPPHYWILDDDYPQFDPG